MKRLIGIVLLTIPLFGICQQKYSLKGIITGASSRAKMYLSYEDNNVWSLDSCQLKNGAFQFAGSVKNPKVAILLLGHEGKFVETGKIDVQSVYLEKGIVQIEGKDSVAKVKIWGTPSNEENQERLALLKGLKRKIDEPKVIAAFVAKYPNSWVSLNWLVEKGGKNALLAQSYMKLSPTLQQTEKGKALGITIKHYLATRPGQPAPDFVLPDPNGKMIRLSDLRGKYVYLDFWASSCKPCRAVHPEHIILYEKLRKTGKFEVLAVSMDRVKAPWVKAIAEDRIPWLNVADLHPTRRNIAAELYGVSILPYGFLIDPNGIIMPEKALSELLMTHKLPEEKKPVGLTGKLSGLSEDVMLAALKKENLSDVGFKQDFLKLYNILETDIGEAALSIELGKLKFPQDSLAIRELLKGQALKLHKQKQQMRQAFIATNPDSFVSLYLLNDLENSYTADGYTTAFGALSYRLKHTSLGKDIQARIQKFKASPTGQMAVNFSRLDQYGKRVQLSDYKGKLVLLDFWGSWCVPCRQSHPHLKELYAKYKSKGLEIVAVANETKSSSLEEARQAWLTAIKHDDVNWVHVLNNDGTDTQDIVKDYGIVSYPTKILLGKDGKILMRVGSMNDEIDSLIEKLLN